MKKMVLAFIVCAIVCLAGCGKKAPAADAPQQPQELTTTVMVYMVGSDLEAKSGAGTDDLDEIAASGIDLQKTNVLVYAGGAPKWHNDLADPEKHTLLQLTADGFKELTTLDAFSMGESQCLSNFLKYGHSNFPAQQYALILWDHGNGPVIGYGKDMLFDNDSLTLQEMQAALEDSPFGEENKLKWVGFDACLMASVELACVWAPYAEYMVASQEVEPAFGWDYDFMGSVCKSDTPQVLRELSQAYLDECLAYYEERGYEDRDTTLSCMDLRYMPELEQAVNALFVKAAKDVDGQYNQLTLRRANTRALGRASTGSEYDLIDLKDMGMWLGELYPDEVIALHQILDKMTVANVTNAENLCGMSLYYPFYNKGHYEKSWAEAYKELGLLPEYQRYLEGYEQIWLGSDKLSLASSVQPSMVSEETYTLQLTPEQADSYASSRYFILERIGDELYAVTFGSSNVTKDDDVLTANFDGNIIYIKDSNGQHYIPVSQEYDTVGDITRYGVNMLLKNSLDPYATPPEGYEEKSEAYRCQLAVDNTTDQIALSALLPLDAQITADDLMGGKAEEVDLSQWTKAFFPHERHRFLTRYDNGAICPVATWPVSGVLTGFELFVTDGIEFVSAPLVAGDYCIIFEVTDTQGNKYCSELLPISVDGKLPEVKPVETISRTWDKDDRVVLWENEELTLFMEQAESYEGVTYTLGMDNRTDRAIVVDAEKFFVNETIDASDDGIMCAFEALPGQVTICEHGISDWGTIGKLQVVDEVFALEFQISARDSLTRQSVIPTTWVELQIAEEYRLQQLITWFNNFWYITLPSRGLYAQQQVLFEDETCRVTLLNMGAYDDGDDKQDICVSLKVENLSDAFIYPRLQGLMLDGVFREASGGPTYVHPGCTTYYAARLNHEELERAGLTSIRTAEVVMRFDRNYTILGLGGFAAIEQYPVKLSKAGTGSRLPTGGKLMFDEYDVRIYLLGYEEDDWGNDWYVLVENDSDMDIDLTAVNCIINGEKISDESFNNAAIYEGQVPDHGKTVARFSMIHFGELDLESMSFDILIYDFTQQKVLHKGNTRIELVVSE